MNSILVVLAFSMVGLVILAKIPGLEHLVRPLIDLVFTAIKAALENSVFWSIWLFKLLLDAHLELFRNLMLSAEALDPSVAMREDSE